MALTENELQQIENTVAIEIVRQLGSYKVDKEQHYQDHLWLKEWREWQLSIKNSIWKSIVGIITMAIFGLLLLGFIFWGSKHFVK